MTVPQPSPTDHRRLVKVEGHTGIYRRGTRYVVIWKHRGKQHKQFFRTKAEAIEAKGLRDSGERRPASRHHVEDYFQQWIEVYGGRTRRGLDDGTRESYRQALADHVVPHLGRVRLRDLGPVDVRDFGCTPSTRTGGAPPRSTRHRRALSAMLATARDDGMVATNPVAGVRYVPTPRRAEAHPPRKRRKLTVADVDQDRRRAAERVADVLRAPRPHGAARRGGARAQLGSTSSSATTRALLRARADLPGGVARRLKTEASTRDVPLSAGAWPAQLAALRDGALDDAPVFASTAGTPLSYANVYNRVLQPALRNARPRGGGGGGGGGGSRFTRSARRCGSVLMQRAGKHPTAGARVARP